MEALLIIGIICVIIYIVGMRAGATHSQRGIPSESGRPYRPRTVGAVYRGIRFKAAGEDDGDQGIDVSGLHDAFTGELLNVTLGLHQCKGCKVFYHSASLAVIQSENRGQCVACQSHEIVSAIAGQPQSPGRDYEADVITIHDYSQHVGRVITFEGYVPKVNVSRDGRSYAVMFEDRSWTKGLKMCVFKGCVSAVGGSHFIRGLSGKRVRVRGLLAHHPRFGYQIIVSQRNMILDVK